MECGPARGQCGKDPGGVPADGHRGGGDGPGVSGGLPGTDRGPRVECGPGGSRRGVWVGDDGEAPDSATRAHGAVPDAGEWVV